MPTVAVDKEELWRRLGREYCEYQSFLDFALAQSAA